MSAGFVNHGEPSVNRQNRTGEKLRMPHCVRSDYGSKRKAFVINLVART